MIDKNPNLNYLRRLRTDMKHVEKRKKIQNPSFDKTSKLLKLFNKKTPKCLDISNQRKKQQANLDSSSTNVHHSKKKINSDKKSTQIDSTCKLREIIVDGCNVAMAYDFFLICAYY